MSTAESQQKRTEDFGTLRAMTDSATKLRQLRQAAGFRTAAEAATRFNWNVNTYKSHENGTRPISKKAAARYANAYRVLPGYLLYEDHPKIAPQHGPQEIYRGELKSAPEHKEPIISQQIGLDYRRVPRLSWEVMASMTNITQAIAESTEFYLVPADDPLPAFSFVVKLKDDSMVASVAPFEDSFRNGDSVIFNPKQLVEPGKFVLAKIFARSEPVFRQYRENGYDKHGRKIVTLHPLNANWADEDIVLGLTGEIIARLIRHSRDYS